MKEPTERTSQPTPGFGIGTYFTVHRLQDGQTWRVRMLVQFRTT
jgi:hypothetical protein